MAQTIYASFTNATNCEQAAGALLDYGVRKEDISLVAHESWQAGSAVPMGYSDDTSGSRLATGADSVGNRVAEAGDRTAGAVTGAVGATNTSANYEQSADQRSMNDVGYRGGETRGGAVLDRSADSYATGDATYVDPSVNASRTGSVDNLSYGNSATADRDVAAANYDNVDRRDENKDIEGAAKKGISVTTGADAAAGAAKGAGWGLGLGILAGIASLAIPGFGLVLGGGALATAIGGAVGTTVAGAAAGGVTGYLKDQGVPSEVAQDYDKTVQQGGAMLAITAPSNNVDAPTIEQVLRKYGSTNVNTY